LIHSRKLEKKDSKYFEHLISADLLNYQEYIHQGWSLKQINNQFDKSTNLSYGFFYNDLMVSFIFGDLINIEKNTEYEIHLIYVIKSFRDKGLGSKLIKKIEENCHHLRKIYLEVSEINLKGISFYQKMGFKKIYTRKSYYSYQNKKADAFLMTKLY
jgi:ribosomal protein S18 acetylase RimI-like enzyme